MRGPKPHPATPMPYSSVPRRPSRGSYACGRCGLPKKGHKCEFRTSGANFSATASTPLTGGESVTSESVSSPVSVARPVPHPMRRRALSFDDLSVDLENEFTDDDEDDEDEADVDPARGLLEVFRRLPPADLLAAAKVCREWREAAVKIWPAVVELRVTVPKNVPVRSVGSLLQKCPGLINLSIKMESDVDATLLACIAFSCRNLQMLEISMSDSCTNWITGDELSHFVAEKRSLTSLKMERCFNLGALVFSSTSLSTIWLSDLYSLSKMVLNCPNLKEISLIFSREENDSTDLTAAVDSLRRSCLKLKNIHIASTRLSHATVLALTASKMRGLRMLSLLLGSKITDASVVAIALSFPKLELLDLSGSNISDTGIGMICNQYAETLTKLLLALCPNISSNGIQFAAAQLPRLQLLDCGMTICDPNSEKFTEDDCELQKTPNSKLHLMYQKLIIKHSQLKKLSLWGCCGLDALHLNCPNLNDLNLNCCTNLHPERLLLQCPNLESVHALDCKGVVLEAIENQVSSDISDIENNSPSKRMADSSKRIRAPYMYSPEVCDGEKNSKRATKRQRVVILT